MGNNELHHWGILGMKWGRRRYQNKDGSLTPEGRKRYGGDDETDEQKREEAKKRAINSGDINEVARWRGEMSYDEFKKALDRVDLEQKLLEKGSKINKSGFDKTMDAINKLDQVRSAGEKLVNSYNLIAKVNNTFNKKFQFMEIDGKTKDAVDAYKDSLINAAAAKEVAENLGKLNAQEI